MIYSAEYTDTSGGEPNYAWVKRFRIEAKSEQAAKVKLSREIGLNFRQA